MGGRNYRDTDRTGRGKAEGEYRSPFEGKISENAKETGYLYEIINPSYPGSQNYEIVNKTGVNTIALIFLKKIKTLETSIIYENGANEDLITSSNLETEKIGLLTRERQIMIDGDPFSNSSPLKKYVFSYNDYSPDSSFSKNRKINKKDFLLETDFLKNKEEQKVGTNAVSFQKIEEENSAIAANCVDVTIDIGLGSNAQFSTDTAPSDVDYLNFQGESLTYTGQTGFDRIEELIQTGESSNGLSIWEIDEGTLTCAECAVSGNYTCADYLSAITSLHNELKDFLNSYEYSNLNTYSLVVFWESATNVKVTLTVDATGTNDPIEPTPPDVVYEPIIPLDSNEEIWEIESFETRDRPDDKAALYSVFTMKLIRERDDDELKQIFFYSETLPDSLFKETSEFQFQFPVQSMLSQLTFFGYGNDQLTPNVFSPLHFDKIIDNTGGDVGLVWAKPFKGNDNRIFFLSEWTFLSWQEARIKNNTTYEFQAYQAAGVRFSGSAAPSGEFNRQWDKFSLWDRSNWDYHGVIGAQIKEFPKTKDDWTDQFLIAQNLQGGTILFSKEYNNPDLTNEKDFVGNHRLVPFLEDKIESVYTDFHTRSTSHKFLLADPAAGQTVENGVDQVLVGDEEGIGYHWLAAWGHKSNPFPGLAQNFKKIHNVLLQIQDQNSDKNTIWNRNRLFNTNIEQNGLGIFYESKMMQILQRGFFDLSDKFNPNNQFSTNFNISAKFEKPVLSTTSGGYDVGDRLVNLRAVMVGGVWNYGFLFGKTTIGEYQFQIGGNLKPKKWDPTRTILIINW